MGIDLGGTNIGVGIVDESFNIVAGHSEKTPRSASFEETVSYVASAAKKTAALAGFEISEIESIGLAVPGIINQSSKMLVNASNLGLRNVPVLDELKKHFDVPLQLGNDADCAALGETLAGAAKKCCNAIMVTLGTGIGGGIIIDKKIFRGADNMGAELGHIKLVYGGEKCACGKLGCFEAYGSATALIRQARKAAKSETLLAGLDKEGARACFDMAAIGDETATAIIDNYTSYVAAGLSTLVVLFRPEVIIIGGGISGAGENLFTALNEKLCGFTFASEEIGVPPVIKAALGNNAGIIGAAMLG